MDLQNLQNFLIILDQKSISNAASIIRIAQPALSRQLRALERSVGAPLLIRQRWGVSPTPAGEVLAEQPRERLICLGGAIDWVLRWQESQAAKQKDVEDKKRAHRRYLDMVLELSKAYALASASDEARTIRDEVGFFQARPRWPAAFHAHRRET